MKRQKQEAIHLEDFQLSEQYVFRPNLSLYPRCTFFFSQHAKTSHLLSTLCPLPSPTRAGPICNSNSLGGANSGSGQKPTIRADAVPFLRSRSTVNCVLCPAMQMCADQSRRDRTTPMRGPLPKTNSSSYNAQGFPRSSSFCGRHKKIMTESFSTTLPPPSPQRLP